MSEALLQNYLIKQAKANGIYARKLVAVGNTGFPDVMIAFNNHAVFIELKNPNGKGELSKKQIREIARLRDQGMNVYIVDSYEAVDEVIRNLCDA